MSKKYNEIMDKVVVTDEMRQRVLKAVDDADPDTLAAYKLDTDFSDWLNDRKRKRTARRLLEGLAVACALILAVGAIRMFSRSSMMGNGASTPAEAAYEEAEELAEETPEGAEEDTMVGAQAEGSTAAAGNGADVKSEGASEAAYAETLGGGNAGAKSETDAGGTAAAADEAGDEVTAEGVTSDRADMPVQFDEPEIRKIVEKYIGPEFEISGTAMEESTLIYAIADVQSEKIFSYIRIDVSDGRVEIEDAQTKEISTLTFREMAGL